MTSLTYTHRRGYVLKRVRLLFGCLLQAGGRVALVRDAPVAKSMYATPLDAGPGTDRCRVSDRINDGCH